MVSGKVRLSEAELSLGWHEMLLPHGCLILPRSVTSLELGYLVLAIWVTLGKARWTAFLGIGVFPSLMLHSISPKLFDY